MGESASLAERIRICSLSPPISLNLVREAFALAFLLEPTHPLLKRGGAVKRSLRRAEIPC